jgi:hypothetical protein
MQGMQSFQLVVHGHQLVADVLAVIEAVEGEEHGLNLALATDQHTALG